MIVIAHVIIALASVAFTTYSYFNPSSRKLHGSYGLMAMTLATGIYLVWSAPARMLQSCTIGVVYVAVVSLGIIATRRKLALVKTTS